MNSKEEQLTNLGSIKIHKKVIASIASLAALEIEGVKRIGGDLKSYFYNLLDSSNQKGIRVEFDKNEEVKIQIPLIVRYDYNIPEVGAKVQENIQQALEKMAGVTIKNIDIKIQGVEK